MSQFYIPAREACIFWDPEGKVVVVRKGDGSTEQDSLQKSGGACWMDWQEASPEELYFRLFQQICHLVINERIRPEVVHRAFLSVPEYRAALPSSHPDVLKDEEEEFIEKPLPDFKGVFNFF